jgi:hypothetical protein
MVFQVDDEGADNTAQAAFDAVRARIIDTFVRGSCRFDTPSCVDHLLRQHSEDLGFMGIEGRFRDPTLRSFMTSEKLDDVPPDHRHRRRPVRMLHQKAQAGEAVFRSGRALCRELHHNISIGLMLGKVLRKQRCARQHEHYLLQLETGGCLFQSEVEELEIILRNQPSLSGLHGGQMDHRCTAAASADDPVADRARAFPITRGNFMRFSVTGRHRYHPNGLSSE